VGARRRAQSRSAISAAALFLSPKTIEYHLRHVCQKLAIHSRDELARALAPLPSDPRLRASTPVQKDSDRFGGVWTRLIATRGNRRCSHRLIPRAAPVTPSHSPIPNRISGRRH
jgi:hypothetical protein